MFRRNSIFVKILIPLIIILLLQPILIGSVLFAYGVFNSLDESAIDSLHSNAINRNLVLTDKMVSAWSNLDRLEYNVINILDDFLSSERLLLNNVIGNDHIETQILGLLSEPLINALRQTTASGAYVYFGTDSINEAVALNGLYYRKNDPLLSAPDNSDLLLLRGPEEIANANNISIDNYWQKMFSFSPEFPENWNTFFEPQEAARNNRNLPSSELAYWSKAISINPDRANDSNLCITYTRPVIFEGRVVAMIGTEVQLSYLERYLPTADSAFEQYGYMLIRYLETEYVQNNNDIKGDIIIVAGSYIKQLIGTMDTVDFTITDRQSVYKINDNSIEPVQAAIQPIKLFNDNELNDEQWAVVAVGTDYSLFTMSRNLRNGILLSSTVALTVGTVLLWFAIKRTTKPLISIAEQIQYNEPAEHIVVDKVNVYEISLLCSTINSMKDERTEAEAELRTERERYLVALESVADTVVEYDVSDDSFTLYYFVTVNDKSELCSNVIKGLTEKIKTGEFCHQDDIENILLLLESEDTDNAVVRIKTEVFPHISDAVNDEGYFWFFIKSSYLVANSGEVIKIIGTARDFTGKKLKEYADIETSHRDSTTKLYNHSYGLNLIKEAVNDALNKVRSFSLSIISINNYDQLEAYYGRTFAASILMELFAVFPSTGKNIKARISNDEVLMFIQEANTGEVIVYANKFLKKVSRLYTGENYDLQLSVSIGTALSDDASDFDVLMLYASRAAQNAAKHDDNRMVFYSDVPYSVYDSGFTSRNRPINVFLDVEKGNISNYTFDLFESTADTHSAINMLLLTIGRLYSLKQILICAYNTEFGTGRITHKWNTDSIGVENSALEKITQDDHTVFEAMLDVNGSMTYTGKHADSFNTTFKQFLCLNQYENTGGYCCVMYENGVPFSRILFQAETTVRDWTENELRDLHEISKIIAVNLSNEKSLSASHAKSEFLSRISHEIRTPMNAIVGMTNIAKSSMNDTERLSDALDKIDFSAKHLLSLINNVLEMSRIENGKIDIEDNYFTIDKFITDVEKLMRPSVEDNEISLDLIKDYSYKGQLLGDEFRLRQVIINLLSNANKFTQKNGSIKLMIKELSSDGKFINLMFSVMDDGVGIDVEDQSNIFKTFEQARASSSSQKQLGSGLGLAISSNIVSAMGGTIMLSSTPGKGSEFYFTLKLKQVREAAPEPDEADSDARNNNLYTGKSALVVDDVDVNIEVAKLSDGGEIS